MSSATFFLIFKGLIGFAIPFGLAWRELVKVNRLIAERKAREAAEASAVAGGEQAGVATRGGRVDAQVPLVHEAAGVDRADEQRQDRPVPVG